MSLCNERFRNEFAARIFETLPQDQVKAVLDAFDATSYDYDIEHKKYEIITTDGTIQVVKAYLAAKAIGGLSFETIRQYQFTLFNFFNTVKKVHSNICPDDIRMYLNYYLFQIGRSKAYVDQIRVRLNTFFQWLVDNGHLIRNPCAPVERIKYTKKKKEAFTPYQLETIKWDAAQIDIRTRALIDILYSSGMRIDECAHVKLTDIDWTSRKVFIHHGKGDKERIVYFDAESELTLRKYLETRKDNLDALFVSSIKPYHAVQKHALENALKKVGVLSQLHVHAHKFRRTFATRSANSGMNLSTLQTLMGHADPKTTMHYVTMSTNNLQNEHQRVYA